MAAFHSSHWMGGFSQYSLHIQFSMRMRQSMYESIQGNSTAGYITQYLLDPGPSGSAIPFYMFPLACSCCIG
jgi:hypothetical protein